MIACGHVLPDDSSGCTWLPRPCHGAVSAVVHGCSRLLEFVNRIRQTLLIGSHIPPDVPVAPMARELHGVVDTFFIGDFAEQRMAEDVRGDDEMLIGREMGIGLPGDASNDDERLGAVEPFAAARGKEGTGLIAARLQPLVEDLTVSFLDGQKSLHMAPLAQHIDKATAVILRQVEGQQLADPQPRAEQRRQQRMIAHALMRAATAPHAQRLRRVQQAQLLKAT